MRSEATPRVGIRRASGAWGLAATLAAVGCSRAGDAPAEPPAGTAPAAAEATTPARSCVRLDLTPLKVVRVDEPQRRLFVVAPDIADTPLAARVRDLESCFDFTDWAGRWSLSVFTDDALARYKDDPLVEGAVRDGRWARAYLAEYEAATKRLTRNPAGQK
jgi:hypothetical protein